MLGHRATTDSEVASSKIGDVETVECQYNWKWVRSECVL